ncbi:MAG: DUF6851 domain-containing protein [Chitinophagaceae bacterium]
MKRWFKLLLILVFISGCNTGKKTLDEPLGENNLAYKWGKIALLATGNDTERFRPRPTVTSRILGLMWTAIFDAWSRYDSKAKPVFLKNVERVPEKERTLKNKETAISYAAYRAMLEYFFSDSIMLRDKMKEFGFDPANISLDPTTPEGIGNLAAKSVIEARILDGSNQTGTTAGSDGTRYSDYTGYKPLNTPDKMNDIRHWQPKYFEDGKGGKFAPDCLTPHWGKVKPLFLDSANEFRPGPPPEIGSDQLKKEVKEVVDLQGELTYEQKALIEFMRDGPRSVQQAGHWFIFAQNVSIRDQHTLDEDVKMYFLVESAAMDAFIACWDTKLFYDYARPYALVHHYYSDEMIKAWNGPEKGTMQVKGKDWRPYSPATFLCPAFPLMFRVIVQ